MEVSLQSSQHPAIVLGYQALTALIHALPDSPDYLLFYSEQAGHPSSQVREAIAGKNHLSESAIQQLVRDSSSPVLERLACNPKAQALLSPNILTGIFARSIEASKASKAIAYTLDRWNDRKILIEKLVHHSDPSVRHALAENSSTPKPILAELTRDKDSDVKEAALRSLIAEFALIRPPVGAEHVQRQSVDSVCEGSGERGRVKGIAVGPPWESGTETGRCRTR